MAKTRSSCNSSNVPEETLVNEVEKTQEMIDACQELGGNLEIRVLYGCSPNKRLGDSQRIPWPPENYRDRELTDAEKEYLANELRRLMEEAEKEATRNCPQGTETGFAVQGFCKDSAGVPIARPGVPGEVNPPFVPIKK